MGKGVKERLRVVVTYKRKAGLATGRGDPRSF